jgi:iron complex outermembrane receptor protein
MVGFSQNIRREYDHPTDPNQAGMYVRLNTVNYRVKYAAPTTANIETSFGINGMYQNNKIKDATDFPIPNYDLLEFSPFLFAKWKNERWTVSGGASYDYRHLTTYDLYIKPNPNNGFTFQVPLSDTVGSTKQFTGLDQTFKGVSFSIGTTYKVTNQISLKANFAKGYRAPNISEIASSGLDPGAHIYYEGNRNFVPEYNFQEDIGIMGEFKDLSASFSIFNNNIQNYIYLTEEVDPQGDPIIRVQGNKTFQYQQSTAQIYGMEAMVNIHPRIIKGFSFNNNFAMTYGFNRKGEFENKGIYGEYLPFIPPAKLLSSLNQEINTKSKIFPSINFKAEIDVNGTQNRYLALYKTETPTPGYALLNLGMGTDIRLSKKTTVQFQFQVNNLFDAIYQSNLSRLKYFEYYTQSPNGYAGIYGMGRNFCIKLIVPLGENN